MAHRQSTPKQQRTFAANAAILVTAAILGAPAFAAAPSPGNVPVSDIESVSSASLLAPRAEAAIRDAFEDSDLSAELPPSETTVKSDTQVFPIREMNTKLPGISDVASSRYKKQMFRRDI